NLGQNYKYQASEEEPFEVYYDDFDENGLKDIVLSYYNFGEKYPVRGRSCSAQQIPALASQFNSYASFASSSLSQIYPEGLLNQSLHLTATSFASVYVENLGDGKLGYERLPVQAQFSAMQDAIIMDVNGDGNADVLSAGNLYVSEIETPRNDAGIGLAMLGNGKGKLTPLSALESGVYLGADIRKLRPLILNGQSVIVVAANDGQITVLRPTYSSP
ncbi:MAG: hypothetical protein AAFV07_18050, partial [Bacteroidota bacterium]